MILWQQILLDARTYRETTSVFKTAVSFCGRDTHDCSITPRAASTSEYSPAVVLTCVYEVIRIAERGRRLCVPLKTACSVFL
jgi:hypothetical protein